MKIVKKHMAAYISVFFLTGIGYAEKNNKAYPLLEKLVNQQQYPQAYQRAIKLRAMNEGDPRFDYLYGLSALQTGHYNEAIFSLERVVASEPSVIRARLELARAYLKLNNNKAAIREFKQVLTLKPPAVVRQNVNNYLGQLKTDRWEARKAVINSLLTLSLGFDDNINFGFENDEIVLPVFGSIRLDNNSIQQESGFAEARFQLSYRKADSHRFNRFASAALTHRDYFDNGDFNLTDLDFRTGFTFNKNQYQYQMVFRDRPVLLGGEYYTNTVGMDVALRRGLGLGAVLTASLTYEDYRHKVESLRNRTRMIVSAKIDKKAGNNIHQFSAFYGEENPDDDAGKQFSRDLTGIGYRMVHNWSGIDKSYVKLAYQHNQHQGPYPIYPDAREDDRITVKVGHERKLNKHVDLLLGLQYSNNDSNLTLYDVTRTEAKIGVRYDWD